MKNYTNKYSDLKSSKGYHHYNNPHNHHRRVCGVHRLNEQWHHRLDKLPPLCLGTPRPPVQHPPRIGRVH